jgi:cytochrome bd-type quinol oxidase subunit 2
MTIDLGSGVILAGLIAVVVWLLCAWFCWQQAQERGRRPWLWGVLGILFGPIALAAILLLPYPR